MHTSGVSQNTSESQCLMESNCAGLILHRQKPPLTRRSLVYYCSGVHTRRTRSDTRFHCALRGLNGGAGFGARAAPVAIIMRFIVIIHE